MAARTRLSWLMALPIAEASRLMAQFAAMDSRRYAAKKTRLRRLASVTCRCGRPGCDCERWERIYREKFEDPTYYTSPQSRGRSTLAETLTSTSGLTSA